jgi:hypothetical protein
MTVRHGANIVAALPLVIMTAVSTNILMCVCSPTLHLLHLLLLLQLLLLCSCWQGCPYNPSSKTAKTSPKPEREIRTMVGERTFCKPGSKGRCTLPVKSVQTRLVRQLILAEIFER